MVDLTQIILAVITLIGSLVSVYLIPYIKNKVSAEKFDNILMWTQIAVQSAEMIYNQSGQGEMKKKYVIAFLKDKGFTLNDKEIEALIESYVLELKKGAN